MQYRSVGRTLGVSQAKERPPPRVVSPGLGVTAVEPRSRQMDVAPCEVGPVSVEYLVRAARITDVDRLIALSRDAVHLSGETGSLVAPDLLRQLVYLPQASILVAEEGRELAGGAMLALRFGRA